MIKIDWGEVEDTKERLRREGATNSFQMVIIVLYHSKSGADRVKIRLEQLEAELFSVANNSDVKSIFLYDVEMKKPYLKCEEADRANILETVPQSGHPQILLEFDEMPPEGRDVWLDITLAEVQHYLKGNHND